MSTKSGGTEVTQGMNSKRTSTLCAGSSSAFRSRIIKASADLLSSARQLKPAYIFRFIYAHRTNQPLFHFLLSNLTLELPHTSRLNALYPLLY